MCRRLYLPKLTHSLTHRQTHTHAQAQTHTHRHACRRLYLPKLTHSLTHKHAQAYTHRHRHTHIGTRIHTLTHTHTRAHMAYCKMRNSAAAFWMRFLFDEKAFASIIIYSTQRSGYASAYR